MQGIYTYIPETNYVPREYSVAALLLLLFMVLISLVPVLNVLYFYVSTFPKYVCSVQYGCFLEFLDFMFFWYVAHVFSKWLWNSPSRPSYYWYHLCCYYYSNNNGLILTLYWLRLLLRDVTRDIQKLSNWIDKEVYVDLCYRSSLLASKYSTSEFIQRVQHFFHCWKHRWNWLFGTAFQGHAVVGGFAAVVPFLETKIGPKSGQ